ncbi:LOW QUALITY PROTEIN: U3 small nucleolar RNA-associated protein 18 homolog [Uloborus diversus]|uniref:LOW QUALITY PROTEIN: U3 small nucleolar RNA-associated protein 18 homolog n=1 Tax=Uloborus diversus TaxID=327109 RepID=UPI00240917B4|nr:LOW QUALITY PROTEIN: U3 small nucleolar RNA-associated protein 18 homolog [Uloborus diversus]
MNASKKGKETSKRKLKLSGKELHKQKKKAVKDLRKLQEVLGQEIEKSSEEKELQRIVFGYDSDDLEDPDESTVKLPIKKEKMPAWNDEDDDLFLVKEKAKTLHNCHRSVYLRGEEKYTDYVEEKFKKLIGDPKWAQLKSEDQENFSDASEDELMQQTGNVIATSKSLRKGTLRIKKCPTLIDENFRNTIIKSFEFHPTSHVALVASTSGTLNLFQIDGKINSKIQSVHFENFPIHTAHFTADGNEIVAGSNKFGHFFTYDMISGKTSRVPWDKGMEQKNVRRFHISPDGKFLAIHGRYGNIHLVTTKTKEWVGSLKMNGEVIAITFNKDGTRMYSHGDTGEIYVWDMLSRKCIHKFVDEGCIVGTSLAVSPNDQFLAAGSDTGIVNIYDNNTLLSSSSPQPQKVLKNLTTEVTNAKFNCTSELLAVSSSHKPLAIKLVHFPSMTVFSNFPIKEDSAVKYINVLDISLNSGYLGLGNNVGSTYIYRLKHFDNY